MTPLHDRAYQRQNINEIEQQTEPVPQAALDSRPHQPIGSEKQRRSKDDEIVYRQVRRNQNGREQQRRKSQLQGNSLFPPPHADRNRQYEYRTHNVKGQRKVPPRNENRPERAEGVRLIRAWLEPSPLRGHRSQCHQPYPQRLDPEVK